jgi:hypothetical protein
MTIGSFRMLLAIRRTLTDKRSPSDVTHVKSNTARGGLRPSWKKTVDEASLEHVKSAEEPNGTVTNGADNHKLEEGKGYREIEETMKDQPPVEASRRRPRTDSDLDSLYAEAMQESPGNYTNYFHFN